MENILVIDDHALVRDGMRLLLEGMEPPVTVFGADSCEAGLALIERIGGLDLLLLDLALPGTSGLAGIPLFQQRLAGVPIVILSASEQARDARAALDAGARGFIQKSASRDVMCSAIRLVLAGGLYLPPLLAGPEEQASPRRPPHLTPRQLEVLGLIAEGKANKVIGQSLGMSESTVRVHVTAIFKALAVTNRTEAALAASRFGLVATQPMS